MFVNYCKKNIYLFKQCVFRNKIIIVSSKFYVRLIILIHVFFFILNDYTEDLLTASYNIVIFINLSLYFHIMYCILGRDFKKNSLKNGDLKEKRYVDCLIL